MAWWAEQDSGTTATLRKAAKKPGANWVQIPGATDSMTQAQAAQVLAQDIADGKFGESLANGFGKLVPGPLKGLAAIGDFFSRLTEGNTWIRIGEGLLGVILIAIGIARMTHAVPVATKIAGAVA